MIRDAHFLFNLSSTVREVSRCCGGGFFSTSLSLFDSVAKERRHRQKTEEEEDVVCMADVWAPLVPGV